MCLRNCILLAALLAVLYVSTIEAAAIRSASSEEQPSSQELVRQKRFLLPTTAILGAKALLSAAAWSVGLAQGAIYGGTYIPVYVHHSYPAYRTYYPSHHGHSGYYH